MTSKRTVFNELWLNSKMSPEFVGWLCKGPDTCHAYCRACKKSFELGNMGLQAVISHAKGKKHVNLKCVDCQTSLKNFFVVVK
ncbi:hypothetical protein PR048_014624 [Dryococelus australis]|uniref:Uncharacterized protein n=1 Tax=Dryococelus australis TaxID=614101 RepID=A0ABQ9HEQ9_9NEOP|nr:hypothetical protein PR048_014624 [Dryococelus australis]